MSLERKYILRRIAREFGLPLRRVAREFHG